MMRQDYYMDRIDLTDAYYSVPIGFSDFEWMKYKYECMLNGLSSAPRIPAKFLKPVLSTLRKHGHQAMNYLDNSFLVGDKFEKYLSSGRYVDLLSRPGFQMFIGKPVFMPTQKIEYL